MSKRYLCPSHAHYLGVKAKPVQLSTEHCTICRWKNRPMSLGDFAREFENIAFNLRIAQEDPEHDPFGFTFAPLIENTTVEWLKMIHKDYRKNFLDRLVKEFDRE